MISKGEEVKEKSSEHIDELKQKIMDEKEQREKIEKKYDQLKVEYEEERTERQNYKDKYLKKKEKYKELIQIIKQQEANQKILQEENEKLMKRNQ